MDELEKEVIAWHREQFAWATVDDIEAKLDEELAEFRESILDDFANKNEGTFCDTIVEEFADMCIVMIAGLAKSGKPGIAHAIRRKLEINKKRKWNQDGTREK